MKLDLQVLPNNLGCNSTKILFYATLVSGVATYIHTKKNPYQSITSWEITICYIERFDFYVKNTYTEEMAKLKLRP